MRRRAASAATGALLALALPLAAIADAGSGAGAQVRLTLDNDHFNFWQKPGERPDFGYTHGTEIAIHVPRGGRPLPRWLDPAWLGRSAAGGDAAIELRLRQDIYSPWRLPEDRPFAGWLGVAFGASRASPRSRREILALAGVTGPPSGAGALQREMHRAFDQGPPPDWSRQLPAEPGFGLEAGVASLGLERGRPGGPALAIGSSARARLATFAVDLRLGGLLAAGWSPPGPWPGAVPRRRGPSLHVRLEPRIDWIVRDEFLDGPAFGDGTGTEPGARRLVAESRVAAGAGWGPFGVEYAVTRRSREFDGQPKPHTYSSLSAIWSR